MRVNNFSVLVPQARETDSGHATIQHGTVYHIRLGNHDYRRRCDAEVSVDGKVIGLFRINANDSFTLERPADNTGRFTFFDAGTDEAKVAGVDGITKDDRGLIQVTFKPERVQYVRPVQPAVPFVPYPNPIVPFHPTTPNPYPPVPIQPSWTANAGSYGYNAGMKDSSLGGGVTRSCNLRSCNLGGEHAVKPCGGIMPIDVSAGITGLTGTSDQQFTSVACLDYDPAAMVCITIRLVCSKETTVRPLQAVPRNANAVPAPVG